MTGKEKCRMLKEIRQRIADENDIPYVTSECRFQGECRGTCPRCESELRYLERQLALRQSMKKKVTVAALCAGMVIASAGCNVVSPGTPENDLGGAAPPYENTELTTEVTTGEVAPDESTEMTTEEAAEPSTQAVSIEDIELSGEVPYEGPSEEEKIR